KRSGYPRRALSPPPPLRELVRQKLRQHFDARGAWAAGRRDEMHGAFRLLPALEDHFHVAGGDGIADDELRQIRDAEAREQGRHQRFAVVDTQGTTWPHARLLAGGVGVMPDIRRREIGVTEALVLGE